MDKIEILTKLKATIDQMVAEKKQSEAEQASDGDSAYLAVIMSATDAIISAIEDTKIDEAKFAQAFQDAVEKINISVPELKSPDVIVPPIRVPEAKVTVNIPEIKLPTINVPEPRVTVNVPEVKIPPFPAIQMPESMEIHGDVGLFGYGFDNPLPVQLRDAKGNPIDLSTMAGGAVSGGGGRFVKVTNDASSPIPITGSITANPGATYFASDAVGSVNIVQSIPLEVTVVGATSTVGVVTINPDGLPVYGGSSGGGLTNAELRASSIDVQQASGASWSTSVLSMPAVVVTSITNSTAVTLLNGEGVARDTWGSTQVGTWNIGTVASITATTAVALIDSSGIQYSGSNPVSVQATLPGVSAIGNGSGSVTTAGTAVNVAANACKRVMIFNNPANANLANGGVIVVGSATVVAAEATRSGATIYPGNSQTFSVSNTNLLYIDATDNGAKYHFYYEN